MSKNHHDYHHDYVKHGHWAARLGTLRVFRTPFPISWYKYRHRVTKRMVTLAKAIHASSINAWAQKLDNL